MHKCKNCGAVLPSRKDGEVGRTRLYCNRRCYNLAKGLVKNAIKLEKCLWCDADLNQDDRRGNPKRFCNKQHNSAYHHSLKPKKPQLTKVCDYCSQSFLSAFNAIRFCSPNCRAEGTKQEGKAERAKLDRKSVV